MEKITSVKNNNIQFVKSLKDKKVRKQSNLFIVEGLNIVKDIPSHICVESLFFTEDCQEYAQKFDCQKFLVDEKVFNAIAETVTPSGILAVVKNGYVVSCKSEICLVLDGVTDPGNVGTILRTAVACDVQNVFCINTADCFSGKVVRSSMSAIFNVNIINTTYEQLKDLLKGKQIVTLDMNGENLFLSSYKNKNIALVVGSEAHGISQQIKLMSNKIVSLPMSNKIESLNASVSLSVALYFIKNFGG
ncbi:MAG: RNA methyltransferase [Clostridia bacterium]